MISGGNKAAVSACDIPYPLDVLSMAKQQLCSITNHSTPQVSQRTSAYTQYRTKAAAMKLTVPNSTRCSGLAMHYVQLETMKDVQDNCEPELMLTPVISDVCELETNLECHNTEVSQ